MNRKIPAFALTLALAAMPLAACGGGQQAEGTSANIIPIQVEVYLPGFMRDSSPIILKAYDADGNALDQIPIEYSQVEANRVTVYAPDTIATIDIVAPINPDGSTYEIENAEKMVVERDGVVTISGELTNIHGISEDKDAFVDEFSDAVADALTENETDGKVDEKREKTADRANEKTKQKADKGSSSNGN